MEQASGSNEKIDLGYLTLSGKFWGPETGDPTIALHGYLDNANSFDMIAPHLDGLRIFALDFAGHGWSEYRRSGELYSGLNDLRDVLAVADALDWQSFNIIGHSMGAEIGSQLAGMFPDRVNALICIDGYCGTNNAQETLGHIKSSIAASFKQATQLRVFPDLDAMMQRLCEATGQNEISARCLIERGHRAVEGGYTWITDPRIRGSGPLELTRDQLIVLLDSTVAATLLIVADMENEWLKPTIDVLQERAAPQLQLTQLPGHHHLHMQDQAMDIVELIRQFLQRPLEKSA